MNNEVKRIRPNGYHSWVNMKSRCLNPNFSTYPSYGGRGITICESWHRFSDFIADMGPPPSKDHTIDRIDNSLGYSKKIAVGQLRRSRPIIEDQVGSYLTVANHTPSRTSAKIQIKLFPRTCPSSAWMER